MFIKLLFYMAVDKLEASTTIDIHQLRKQYNHARVINPFEQCHRHLTCIFIYKFIYAFISNWFQI